MNSVIFSNNNEYINAFNKYEKRLLLGIQNKKNYIEKTQKLYKENPELYAIKS